MTFGRPDNATQELAAPAQWLPGNGEMIALAVLLVAFLAVNLATGMRSPVVWTDEVFFADPAVNLAWGHGFNSSVWPQPEHQFFAANVPLYPLLLAGWIKIVGFTPLGVRSLNYVLMCACAVVLWIGMGRSGLVTSQRGRLLVLVLLMLCYEITFSYRSGRYDVLCMLLSAIGFLGFTAKKRSVRLITALLVGAAMPMAGLQLVIYAAVMLILLTVFLGAPAARYGAWLFTGVCTGVAGLALVYHENGVLPFFLGMVLHTSVTGQVEHVDKSLAARAIRCIKNILGKPTVLFGLLLAALMVWKLHKQGRLHGRSVAVFALAAGVGVPLGMQAAYDFPIYYGWMVNIPLLMCIVATLGEFKGTRDWKTIRAAAVICLGAAAAAGLPFRLATTALEWQNRDYAPAEAFVAQYIMADDRAVIDHAAYYPVKHAGAVCYGPYHLPYMTDEEKSAVTAMVIEPANLPAMAEAIGGRWNLVAEMPPPAERQVFSFLRHSTDQTSYHLAVYRRSPN